MLKNPIQLGSFQVGLGSLGKLEQNKFQTLENVEIHDEIGICANQLALTVESTTPNEPCVEAIDNAGNTFFCSTTTGKIWKRTTAGSYSLEHTNANTAHRGARYFNGYLWFWTATKLGHYDLASTWTDSFATGTDFREGIEANNTLLLANGRYTARVDAANAFSANEFVIPALYKQTCLKNIGDDVLVGTTISEDVAYCRVFLWDTVSTSYSYEDEVFEAGGIRCFIQLDNIYICQAGNNGHFYYWTGSKMAYFGKIRGITTALGEQKSATLNRRPLFACGTKIYSIHSEENGLPTAFVCEYTITSGSISSIIVQGQNLLISTGTGVEKQTTTYAVATIETAEIQAGIQTVEVKYDNYPAGIGIFTKTNNGDYVEQTVKINTDEMTAYFDGGIPFSATCQAKIVLTPSGANRCKIKSIIFK